MQALEVIHEIKWMCGKKIHNLKATKKQRNAEKIVNVCPRQVEIFVLWNFDLNCTLRKLLFVCIVIEITLFRFCSVFFHVVSIPWCLGFLLDDYHILYLFMLLSNPISIPVLHAVFPRLSTWSWMSARSKEDIVITRFKWALGHRNFLINEPRIWGNTIFLSGYIVVNQHYAHPFVNSWLLTLFMSAFTLTLMNHIRSCFHGSTQTICATTGAVCIRFPFDFQKCSLNSFY